MCTKNVNKQRNKSSLKKCKNCDKYYNKLKEMSSRPYRISIEGNIGSGKTTVLNYYSQFTGVETYEEPIHLWQDLNGYNLLNLSYKDTNKWFTIFQNYVQVTRLNIQTTKPKNSDTKTQIFERSVQNNRYTFIELAYSEGYLKGAEYDVLLEWFNCMEKNIDIEIDYIVYLRTSPEKVFERIKTRNRSEENEISFDYIKKLHYFHEKWLLGDEKNSLINKNKLLVIDADQSLEHVFNQCEINKELIVNANNKFMSKNSDN